jgi:hypothetical protein
MSFSYFEADANKGQKYARLYPPKAVDKDLSCQITFEEFVLQKNDAYIILTGKIKQHTAGITKSFKEHTCVGETVIIRLLNKETHETTFKGETKTNTQSILEKFLCNRLSALDFDKAYAGTIRFRWDGMLSYLLDTNPSAIPASMRETEEKAAISLVELGAKTIEPEETKNGFNNGKTYSKSQTELEKLNDRLEFTLSQMRVLFPDYKLETIRDLMNLLSGEEKEAGYVSYCLSTISSIANLSFIRTPF